MKYKRKIQNVNTDEFNLSISDLMAGLVAIFILVLCYYILTYSKTTDELRGNTVMRTQILQEITSALKKENILIKVDEKRGILTLPEGAVYFPSGYAETNAEGEAVIKQLSEVLYFVLQKKQYKGKVETIFIEGHTDNVPVSIYNYYQNNWNLSTARAVETWHLMLKYQPELGELENNNSAREKLFSCSGYAETRPIASNDTEEGKEANRRIDIRFTMTPPQEESAEIIKDIENQLR